MFSYFSTWLYSMLYWFSLFKCWLLQLHLYNTLLYSYSLVYWCHNDMADPGMSTHSWICHTTDINTLTAVLVGSNPYFQAIWAMQDLASMWRVPSTTLLTAENRKIKFMLRAWKLTDVTLFLQWVCGVCRKQKIKYFFPVNVNPQPPGWPKEVWLTLFCLSEFLPCYELSLS